MPAALIYILSTSSVFMSYMSKQGAGVLSSWQVKRILPRAEKYKQIKEVIK